MGNNREKLSRPLMKLEGGGYCLSISKTGFLTPIMEAVGNCIL